MSVVAHLTSLRQHGEWADRRLLEALRSAPQPIPEALRELCHVRGAQEIWLSRVEQRSPTLPIWPALSIDELGEIGRSLDQAWRGFIEQLRDPGLSEPISYVTSGGEPFTTPVGEILLHMLTHGQYHRGKANAALRAVRAVPPSVDYIVWTRVPKR